MDPKPISRKLRDGFPGSSRAVARAEGARSPSSAPALARALTSHAGRLLCWARLPTWALETQVLLVGYSFRNIPIDSDRLHLLQCGRLPCSRTERGSPNGSLPGSACSAGSLSSPERAPAARLAYIQRRVADDLPQSQRGWRPEKHPRTPRLHPLSHPPTPRSPARGRHPRHGKAARLDGDDVEVGRAGSASERGRCGCWVRSLLGGVRRDAGAGAGSPRWHRVQAGARSGVWQRAFAGAGERERGSAGAGHVRAAESRSQRSGAAAAAFR